MTWVLAIALALAAFAAGAIVFRLPRATWTSFLAALTLGLTGYALQANPGLMGSPAGGSADEYEDEWQIVDTRKTLVTGIYQSRSDTILTADAFMRRGQFVNAAGFLSHLVIEQPENFEAWLALANALTEQADGILTQSSVYAYSRAAEIAPEHPAPGYFLGLALIRQGRMMEARQVWRAAVEAAPEEEPARAFVAERLERLDMMLQQAGAMPAAEAQQ